MALIHVIRQDKAQALSKQSGMDFDRCIRRGLPRA